MSHPYTIVKNKAEWDAALKTDKPVFVDFFAEWCGPCKMIAPLFEQLATEYCAKVLFVKVDVDVAEDVAAECEISAMPTFKVYKDGQNVQTMVGANPDNMKKLVATLAA